MQPDNTSRAMQLIAARHDLLHDTASLVTVRDTSKQLRMQCVKPIHKETLHNRGDNEVYIKNEDSEGIQLYIDTGASGGQ